jgi:muramoyltetrapeptide carboxypeptidase
MIIPPYIAPGDQIAIVAPARKITVEELSPALEQIRSWGFVPVLGKNVYEVHNQFAGTDEQRLADMQWALDDPEIKAVIAARGGYGCLRLIDRLDFSEFTKRPKWLVGYSDLTVFHSHINKTTNVATIHATMPINFHKDKHATQTLFNALSGKTNNYSFSLAESKNAANVDAIVMGGNLSLLYSMLGSVSDVDTDGKILFIEDLDEYLYHIDRMMVALKRAGKLKNLRALLVGSFTEMKDNSVPFGKNIHEIILDAVKEYDFPVFFNFPAGHQDLNNAITMGKTCTLSLHGGTVKFCQG